MIAVVIPNKMRETCHRLDRCDTVQFERSFRFIERAECVLEYSSEKLLLATEVVIEHAFISFRAAGNLIDACAEQPSICKLFGRRKQNAAPRAFRISFDFRLIHGGFL